MLKYFTFFILLTMTVKAGGPMSGFQNMPLPPNHPLNPLEIRYLDAIRDTPSKLFQLSPDQLKNLFNKRTIGINAKQSVQLKQALEKLKQVYAKSMMMVVTVNNLKSQFPFLAPVQVEKLFNILKAGDIVKAEKLLVVLFFERFNIPFLSADILKALAKRKTEPTQPNSATQLLSKSSFKAANQTMRRRYNKPKSSGEWGLDNIYVAGDYQYTEFEDTASNDAGHSHYKSLTFGADLSEHLSLSLSTFHDEFDQRGPNDIFSREWGLSLTSTVHINENYSVGAFTFYSQTDIENLDPHTYSYGGGLMFITYHTFGDFEISTINSIVKSFTEFDHDTIYLANVRLGYNWTDWLNTGIYGFYVDSMRRKHAEGLDTTYTIFGADITFQLTDNLFLTFGAETVQHLKEYESETFYTSVRYNF